MKLTKQDIKNLHEFLYEMIDADRMTEGVIVWTVGSTLRSWTGDGPQNHGVNVHDDMLDEWFDRLSEVAIENDSGNYRKAADMYIKLLEDFS